LEKENSLEPGSEQLYFPLREDAEAAVLRGIRWTDASPKDLVLIQLVFTAVGVATLWPDVLYNQPDGDSTRYRFNGTLHKEFRSADGVPFYSILKEKLQFVLLLLCSYYSFYGFVVTIVSMVLKEIALR
jgi:hypothetical protein